MLAEKSEGRRCKDSQNNYVHNSKGTGKGKSTLEGNASKCGEIFKIVCEIKTKQKNPLKFRTAVVKGQLIKGTISNNPDAGKREEIETQDIFNNTDNQKGIVFKVELCWKWIYN